MEFKDDVKHHTDYSNTIIYKITCKDPTITDLYVGHTTDFVRRKKEHMYSSISKNTERYKCKLYKTIRSNGGWSNWSMDTIACFDCADIYAARKKEQEYYISLNATLNSAEPSNHRDVNLEQPTSVIRCERLNSTDVSQNTLERAGIEDGGERLNSVDGTPMSTQSNNNNNNKPSNAAYVCSTCNFETHNKTNFKKHNLTIKHLTNNNNLNNVRNMNIYTNTFVKRYVCACDKKYLHHSSLWNHKKQCEVVLSKNTGNELPESIDHVIPTHIQSIAPVAPLNPTIPSDTIYELLKEIVISNQQNTEFKQIIVEQQAKLLEILGRTIT